MKTVRKAISKRIRFAVFERNKFTCQYCGKLPPEVTLELDHVVPLSRGGTDEELNLTTSCRDCNAGKTNKEIGRFEPSRDPAMERARLEQERIEIELYLQEAATHARIQKLLIDDLGNHWGTAFASEQCPADGIIRRWLARYSPSTVRDGIAITANSHYTGGLDHPDGGWRPFENAVKYASACMRNIEEER